MLVNGLSFCGKPALREGNRMGKMDLIENSYLCFYGAEYKERHFELMLYSQVS